MKKQNKFATVLAASAIAGLVSGVAVTASAKSHDKKKPHAAKPAGGKDAGKEAKDAHSCKDGGKCNHPEGQPPADGEAHE